MNHQPMVHLEPLQAYHQDEFIEAINRSRELHYPWVFPPSKPETFTEFLAKPANTHIRRVIRNQTTDLVGIINITVIVRGVFQSAYLGYYSFVPHQGKGYMKQGLTLAITEAFTVHGLHRLEANIQPQNKNSIHLINSLGFRLEGFSPRYLKINGQWQDHERYAITIEEWENTD